VKVKVNWIEGMVFMAESDRGHGVMLNGVLEIWMDIVWDGVDGPGWLHHH